ncbi:MAG: hypothetical protein IPL49_17630 [Saprospirales bacterium]|nr:hypothetical protein [Saprospirales bacterium]
MAPFSPLKWLDDLLNPLTKRMGRDMEEMRQELAPWKETLVPLAPKEWELLSSYHFPQGGGRKRRKKAPESGLFGTIYQEPVVAWSYKEYPGKGNPAILVARTYGQEYLYKRMGQDVELVIGPYLVGVLLPDGRLVSSRKKELLAKIGQPNGNYQPIWIYGREAGAITLPGESLAPFPRAFAFLVEMNDTERELFLAVAILELVRQKMNN